MSENDAFAILKGDNYAVTYFSFSEALRKVLSYLLIYDVINSTSKRQNHKNREIDLHHTINSAGKVDWCALWTMFSTTTRSMESSRC